MKKSSIFRLFGLLAFVGLLVASTRFTAPSPKGEPSGIALVQPTADTVKALVVVDTTASIIIKKVEKKHSAKLASKTKTKTEINQDKKSIVLHKGFSSVADTRTCITDYMRSQVGVREKTNNNDGKQVFSYFKTVGWKHPEQLKVKERFWCGAFMGTAWLNCMEKVPFVKSKVQLASVRYWQDKGPGVSKEDALPGDAVTLKGYSHVQSVYERHPNPTFEFYTTISGNTSPAADDSDQRGGVFKKTALWRDVKKVISVKKTLELV
jgi:hypothetical protein